MIRLLSIATLSLLLLPSSYATVTFPSDNKQQTELKQNPGETKVDTLARYYKGGSMLTPEELEGWKLGVRYESTSPDKGEANLLVSQKKIYYHGPLFIEEPVFLLIPSRNLNLNIPACRPIVSTYRGCLIKNKLKVVTAVSEQYEANSYRTIFDEKNKKAAITSEVTEHGGTIQYSFRKYENLIIEKTSHFSYYDGSEHVGGYAYYYEDVTQEIIQQQEIPLPEDAISQEFSQQQMLTPEELEGWKLGVRP